MTYDIIVQDQLYRSFTSDSGYQFQDIAKEVTNAIADGKLVVDNSKPVTIQVYKH